MPAIHKKSKPTHVNPLRSDPSQTGPIRRQFMRELEARFKNLRKRVYQRLVLENPYGLTTNYNPNHDQLGKFSASEASAMFDTLAKKGHDDVAVPPFAVDESSIVGKMGSIKRETHFKGWERQLIPLSDVVATEGRVLRHRVVEFLTGRRLHTEEDPVIVVKIGDKYHLDDGMHRLTAAKLAGRTHVLAHVVDPLTKNERRYPLITDMWDGRDGSELFVTVNYDPSQPRVPAGSSAGGEFTGKAGVVESVSGVQSHADIVKSVTELRDRWNYHGMISLKGEQGREFSQGGKLWREDGNCVLEGEYSGHVTIYTESKFHDKDAVVRLAAHEMMHGTYEKVHQQFREEQSQVASYHIKADGNLKPEFESKFPTYGRLNKFVNDYHKQEVDDGVTEYSKAYWKDLSERKVTQHIACHETLAEIAGGHESTGVIEGSKFYREFYKTVRDEYSILMGSKKRKKVKQPVENLFTELGLFTNHEMYLTSNRVPTLKDDAAILRYWKIDGTHGWAAASTGVVINAPYDFPQSEGYLDQFKSWLFQQLSDLFYPMGADSWWREYVAKGWQLGAARVYNAWKQPSEFLRSSFNQPVSINKVKLLASRVLSELESVTQEMATKMSRELVDGLIQGKSPREVASSMSKAIDGITKQRALTIARTETVRAHAEGQLDTLEGLGMSHVGVAVEWSTSGMGMTRKGNPSPCKLCSPMQGVVFSLEEAKGMIPRHPNCMCSFIPANVGEDTQGQTRGFRGVSAALKRSLKAEIPKRSKKTLAQQQKSSRWGGAKAKISKSRPTSIFNRSK